MMKKIVLSKKRDILITKWYNHLTNNEASKQTNRQITDYKNKH